MDHVIFPMSSVINKFVAAFHAPSNDQNLVMRAHVKPLNRRGFETSPQNIVELTVTDVHN